jgi:hypothetical protein
LSIVGALIGIKISSTDPRTTGSTLISYKEYFTNYSLHLDIGNLIYFDIFPAKHFEIALMQCDTVILF